MEQVRRIRVLTTIAVAVLCGAVSVSSSSAQQKAKKEYAFRGTVDKVDAKAKTLTVNGENVEGWMSAMTMIYGVDNAEVLNRLKAGDKITAKVHEGDFQKLYDVRVVAPPPKK